MSQRVYHRLAGNPYNAGKWEVQIENYQNGAGHRERAGDQARVVVAFAGDSKLNPKKITTSHITRAISNGFETDETACACTSARTSASCTIRVAACVLRARCASSRGARPLMAT